MFLTWQWRKTGKNIDPLYILDYFSGFVFQSHPWWNSKRQTFPTIQTPVSCCNFDIVDPSAPRSFGILRSTCNSFLRPRFFLRHTWETAGGIHLSDAPHGDPTRKRVKLGDPTLIPHGAKVGWGYHVLGNQQIWPTGMWLCRKVGHTTCLPRRITKTQGYYSHGITFQTSVAVFF